jgi:hypothetical protein
MRNGFAHEALIELVPGADERAPGAAVTVALCGHWEHEGTCRWPHHSSVDTRAGQSLRLRVVFACAADDEPTVRQLIGTALGQGQVGVEPDTSRWALTTQGPSGLRPSETALANRLTGS